MKTKSIRRAVAIIKKSNMKTGTIILDNDTYHISRENQYVALPQHEKAGGSMEQWWTVEYFMKRNG